MEYAQLVTEISEFPRRMKKLKRRDEFLILFAKSPPLSVYQIYHDHKSIHKMKYNKQVRVVVKRLLACKLIEEIDIKISNRCTHYYKLSTAGLYYLVYHRRTEFIELFKIVLQQYGKNILFTTLLYPYFKKSTLENIRDTSLVSRIYAHLHECCEEIQRAIETIEKSNTKYLVQQVCIWEDVHERGEDNTRLIDFLREKFGLSWLDKRVQVVKYTDGGTVSISKDSERLLIKVTENRTNATLIYNGRELYRFTVSSSHELLYRSKQTAEDWSVSFLKRRVESSAADLVLGLTLKVVTDSDIRSLSKDGKFLRVLERNKMKILTTYQNLTDSMTGS